MRILVADDEIDMARVLTAILEHEHYAVGTVHGGRAALDYALDGDYDCLVLDIMMPKLSGLEVLRSLRAVNNTVPVLFLTAKGDAADRIAGLDGGADGYLAKPFNMGEFLARVRACARRSRAYVRLTLSGESSISSSIRTPSVSMRAPMSTSPPHSTRGSSSSRQTPEAGSDRRVSSITSGSQAKESALVCQMLATAPL
ncbi:response regulator transcription factor [Collinsella intestinalis]|uniref:response regulator transcription factor n=1 Tax=Collinsella intestinalis TaxID=147207 RepID=UPI0025A343B5|nr:response regulator [Collinsella intestinalis]MDM8163547.1 response regulator [Collinsella intestinalis]